MSAHSLTFTGDELLRLSQSFEADLSHVKSGSAVPFGWYPYGTLNNFIHLREGFNLHPLQSLTSTLHVADIGGADGDLAFFLQSLGYRVDLIDNAPTNYNSLQGARHLIDSLGVSESVQLIERDIDQQFELPKSRYDLVFLLGILYHLKNPFYILEKLSNHAKHVFLSTRVMRFGPANEPLTSLPVAYLLDPDELNNDATNYWIFSDMALHRLVRRAGWEVIYATTVGDTRTSDPTRLDRDERSFLLLRTTRPEILAGP